MEKQIKEIIRSVIREEFISELSKNDVHVKQIMKFYDNGTYSTKKAISIFVSGKTNASRNQILDDLGDMGYNDIWDVMDHFKLKLESVNEGSLYSSQQWIKKLTPKIEKDVESLKKQFPNYNINLVKNRYESDGSYTLSISGKNTSDTDNKTIQKVVASKIKELVNEGDVVPGGLAKGLSLNDIAEKHGVSVDIMVAEFKKGIAVEMEHTTDREVAKEITLDHLFEDPKYYDKLAKVEEYVDKKGVERVAAALPQTEEEPIKECKTCNSK
jgi:hypothetical protein